jgi:hypothetical protein
MDIPLEQNEKSKLIRSRVLTQGCYDPKTYEFDSSFKPYNPSNPLTVHTTAEMLECLANHPEIELDARVLGIHQNQIKTHKINRTQLFESFQSNCFDGVRFKEMNSFAADFNPNISSGYGIGQDFTPLLGGPFFKNLYYYQDYIRMHSECFYAYHHDPIAKAIVQITRDFVIGDGYEMQCDTSTPEGQMAMAAWKTFEEVNELETQMDQICEESSIYGEVMLWKLPGNQDKITFRLSKGDTIPMGIIPRVRLIDPSNIVEIVTYPEDITRPLFYVWLTPTQWQMFTSGLGEGKPNTASTQPSLKFIYRTIPASEMLHFKLNSVSNEKRGRSDYFPVLSYLKRLRDIVDFQLIALQKCSAWGIDTTIEGDQTDLDAYIQDQAALGTVAPAGSEFVHTSKITRQYLANAGASNINSDAFALALSMACAGVQIPVSYIGTHLSGGQTKASALVATEPVAKKFSKRREFLKRILKKLWAYCMSEAGLPLIDCDVVFPEIITQDRSQKLKDLALAEAQRWISPQRAASLAAREFHISGYSYEKELEDMKKEIPEIPAPLTAAPQASDNAVFPNSPSDAADPSKVGVSGLTSEEKKATKINDTHL